MLRPLTLVLLLTGTGIVHAGDAESSGFGKISIPEPAKPVDAEQCVEPVEVMRRDHMKFLDHQRDETVINGDRDSKYSLVGCMNCHNPADDNKIVRYEDPEHFCAECHRYTSVRIDCFECHADRGLRKIDQSRLAWENADLNAATLQHQAGLKDDD